MKTENEERSKQKHQKIQETLSKQKEEKEKWRQVMEAKMYDIQYHPHKLLTSR